MCDLYAYEPPVSLWQLVLAHVNGSESREIKVMLGESMVEQSQELHEEVKTLLEIWRDYREETETATPLHSRLPEPPAARDRLKQEIKFFITNLEEKARESGRNPEEILAKCNSEIMDYAMDAGYSSSRPSTSRSSRDGRETPMFRHTPDSARFSMTSTVSEEIEAMNDKLNLSKFREVVTFLRDSLRDEVKQLLSDVEFLQSCLEDEASFRCESSMSREPTLTELREERSKLEKELLSTADSPIHDPAKAPPRRQPSSLAPTSLGVIKSPPTSASKLRPLKANHALPASVISPTPPTSAARRRPPSGEGRNHTSDTSNATVRKAGQFSQRTPINKLTHDVTHVTIRTSSSSPTAGGGVNSLVGGANAAVGGANAVVGGVSGVVPAPPTSAKPAPGSASRPRSAQRFRKMVLDCRDGGAT